jgi:hypothetical protein
MKLFRGKLSRRELALVAAALLLPVPILAVSGLSAPLPDAIERGIGSVVTLEAEDERSGVRATGDAAENGNTQRRSERGRLRIARKGGLAGILGKERDASGASNDGQTATSDESASAGGDSETPAAGEPEGDGNGGPSSPGSPTSPEPQSPESSGGGSGEGTSSGADGEPELRATVGGQGSGAEVSAGTSGVSVDESADTGEAGSEGAAVGIGVTDSDGSTTDVGVAVPGGGVSLP